MKPSIETDRRREQADQARRDLDELAGQIASGEIDEDTGRLLRATYLKELESASTLPLRNASPESVGNTETMDTPARSRRRMVVGAAILVLGLAVAIGLVGRFVQDREQIGPVEGIAAAEFNPDDYSDETMEAVIAAYSDDPAVADQLPFMRFRLAERYFEQGDYQRAYPHYTAILDRSPPPELAAPSLTRLAWIVWSGNGEAELAVGLLDRALEARPGDPEALYVKAQVLWCGLSDSAPAVVLFEQVLSSPGLDQAVVEQVEADLALARTGGGCS